MPFVSVPKDLSKVKTKVAFNLTKRQLICFSLAGGVGIPAYFFTRKWVGSEASVFMMMFLMMPFFFLAMYEKNGQPMEKVLSNYIQFQLRPKVRFYKTDNMYASLEQKEEKNGIKNKAKRTGKRTKGRKA